jgi:hypothetical protein
MTVQHAPATRAGLTAALTCAPPHLHPIIEAVRDGHVGMMFVGQAADPFRLPNEPGRPAIVIIGDDFDRAVGPSGFHLPSIRRAIRACTAFAVISCEPLPHVYGVSAITATLSRRNVMLIETRPEQELAWLELIQKLAPGRPITLATVEGGHA